MMENGPFPLPLKILLIKLIVRDVTSNKETIIFNQIITPLPSFEMKLYLIGLTCSYHIVKNQEYLVMIISIHS